MAAQRAFSLIELLVAIAIIAIAIATFVIRDIQFVDVHYIAHIRQFHYYPPFSFVSLPDTLFTVLFQSCHTPQQLCVGARLFSVPCCFWPRRLYPLFLSFFPAIVKRGFHLVKFSLDQAERGTQQDRPLVFCNDSVI